MCLALVPVVASVSSVNLALADISLDLGAPEGSATRILAIPVVAPDACFEAVLESATPIIESIEWMGAIDFTIGDVLPEDLRDLLAGMYGLALDDASEVADSLEQHRDSGEPAESGPNSDSNRAARIRRPDRSVVLVVMLHLTGVVDPSGH